MTTDPPTRLNPLRLPHLDAYIDDRRLAGLRDASIYQHVTLVRRFARNIAPTPPHEASSDQIVEFLLRTSERGVPLTQGSRAAESSWLRSWFGWLVRTGRRDDNPTESIPRSRQPRRFPRPIGEPDLEIAIALAAPRMKVWLTLAAYAGMRAAEIAGVRHEDIMLTQHLIVVRNGKGGRPGVVPAHDRVLAVIGEYGLQTSGWLFPHFHDPERPIAPWSVSAKSATYLRSIGIDATIHQLRHRFGTRIYQTSGRDLRTTQELLRHATPVSTAIYTWVDPGDAREAVDAL